MAFTKKRIELVFTLGNGATFAGSSGANQVTIKDLRISCSIVKNAGQMNTCQLRIFGLPPNIYNQLTSIYPVTTYAQKNTVTVMAGDTENLPTVFVGQITIAQIDLNSQPDAVMNIVAQSGLLQALIPVAPTSYPQPFDLATAMQTLATTMGLNFEGNGVSVQMPIMTLTGTARDQAEQLAGATIGASKVNLMIDDKTLVIVYANSSRKNNNMVVVGPDQEPAMIGYPSYSNIGIGLKTVYNPNIHWQDQIQVKSSLQVANLNGLWTVYSLIHNLESEMPDGRWDTEIQASNYALAGAAQ